MKSKAAVRTFDGTESGAQTIIFKSPMDQVKLSFYGITSGYSVTIEDLPHDDFPSPIDGYNTVGASSSDFNYVQTTDAGRYGTSFVIPGKRRGIKVVVTLSTTTSLAMYAESWHSAEVQGPAEPAATMPSDGSLAVEYRL